MELTLLIKKIKVEEERVASNRVEWFSRVSGRIRDVPCYEAVLEGSIGLTP